MINEILIEKTEEAPTLFKVSLNNESDELYTQWIKSTIGSRWVDVQDNGLSLIRENRDGIIYIYDELSDTWDIDVI
jgi:hypothetical protein